MRPSEAASAREAAHLERMAELRPAVLARAGYRCQRCGAVERPGAPLEAHHRLMRSQGGPDAMANLVALCRFCHALVHLHPAESYESGLLIRSSEGPPSEPWGEEPLPRGGF